MKGRLNWAKKHLTITTEQKRVIDKIRRYEKRFISEIISDMIIDYLVVIVKSKKAEGFTNGFYFDLYEEYKERLIAE